ncbi:MULTISPECIES: hypothetical protein [unclassified Variovorax]|uniref:hypothetical protein n=1 Tax=unclassified Variovorax TaxID=663243 RepID=UPI002574D872|nr:MULTISPECIES: hypothetical protein [unclassified Variovorax]MDM0088669.1 hypothetical protein [Variovorax sp. J22G40]MDM0146742.1 hypothetical protein [Variovorax sp. J2P1-31]
MTSNRPCLGAAAVPRSCRNAGVWIAAIWMGIASAQPKEFPTDATPLTAETLKGLEGKKFVGKRADGKSLTLDFGADYGYRIAMQGEAGMLDGKVRLDGDKLCQDMRKTIESSCNDVRVKDNMLFYKRNVNGEVIAFVAQ